MVNKGGKVEAVTDFMFSGSKITADNDCSHEIKRHLFLGGWGGAGNYDKPRQHIEKQRLHFSDNCLYSQSYGFSSSHVQMWDLNHKKGWVPKKRFQMVLLEKTLESLLNCKGIKSVTPKRNQHWIFIGRIDGWSRSSNTLATRCKESIQRERPWFWKRLRAWGEGSHRGYGG